MQDDIKSGVKLILRQSHDTPEDGVVYQLHHFPDADVLVRFKSPDEQDEPDTVIPATAPSVRTLLLISLLAMLLPIASICFQVYTILHPLTANVTILVSQQQVALPGIRFLPQITLSQSQTGPATGKGYEPARTATGTVTFYNGLFTTQFIPRGTVFTGSDGVRIMTDADVSIPAANLPQVGQATVSTHAVNPGASGNIQAGDISIAITNGVLVKNLGAFYGGKDARSYHTVTKDDVNNLVIAIQSSLLTASSLSADRQLQRGEVMATPRCSPVTLADRQVGQEANQVRVTVKETCKASAYSLDRIKRYLAGKNTQDVMHLFRSSGQIAISFSGVGDSSRLPGEDFIHLVFMVQE